MDAQNEYTRDELDPLLEEEHAPWEALGDDLEAGGSSEINLATLFKSRPDDVLRTLQRQGVTKVGEFKEQSHIAYAAFDSTLLTMGSSVRAIDYESAWRRKLRKLAGPAAADKAGWTGDLTVEAFVVNVTNAAAPDKDGLLQPLLRHWQTGGCSLAVFGLPAVQATITLKWSAFARKLLLWQLFIFTIWVSAFFAFTVLFQDEDLTLSLRALFATPRGAITIGLQLITLAAMAPFLVLEQGTLAAYGFKGWLNIWNALDVLTYGMQGMAAVMYLGRIGLKSNVLSIVLSLQCIFLLFRLQYYFRVFKTTRFSFLDTIRDVISEIRFYFVFMMLIMFGFAAAFHILFRRDQNVSNFDTLSHALIKIYSSQSGLDYEEMLNSHVPVAATLLNVVYAFVMGMVLVNLLIGIMSNALNRASEHEALKLLLHKAQIIDELEATLPRWLENKFADKWYPRHIQVLRIDPDRVDKVDLGGIWAAKNDENGGAGNSGGSGSDLAVEMQGVQAALLALTAEVAKMQASAMGGASRPAAGSRSHPATPALNSEM